MKTRTKKTPTAHGKPWRALILLLALGVPPARALDYADVVGNWEVEIRDSIAGRMVGEMAFRPDDTPEFTDVGNWCRSAHGGDRLCLQNESVKGREFYARFYSPPLFPKGGHSSRHLKVEFSEDGTSGEGVLYWGDQTFASVTMRKMRPRVQAVVRGSREPKSPATAGNEVFDGAPPGTIWVRLDGSGLPLHMWITKMYEKVEVHSPDLRFWRVGMDDTCWWLAFWTNPDTRPGRKVITVNGTAVSFNLMVRQPDGTILGADPEVAENDRGLAGTLQTPLGPCTRIVDRGEDGVPVRIIDLPLGMDEAELRATADPESGLVRTFLDDGAGHPVLLETEADITADGVGRIAQTDGFGNRVEIGRNADGQVEITESDVFGHERSTAESPSGGLIGFARSPLGTTVETVDRTDGSSVAIVTDPDGGTMTVTTVDGEREATLETEDGLKTLAEGGEEDERAQEAGLPAPPPVNPELEQALEAIRAEQQEAEKAALARIAREDRQRLRDEATEKMEKLDARIRAARSEGDVEKQRRLEREHDEIHDATLGLFLPTEDEEAEMARVQSVRDGLVDDIAGRARRLADMKVRELDVAQGLKEDVTAGTRYVSIGSEMQQMTAATTRMADREKAFAEAKLDLIQERLADPATTPEQRKILEDMIDLARVQRDGAQRLLNDNARLTTVGYGVDAAMLLSGGIANGAVAAGKGLTTHTVAANAARQTFARQMAAGATRKAATEAAEIAGREAVEALGQRITQAVSTVEGTRMGGALSAALKKDLVPEAVQSMAGRLGEHQLVQTMVADAAVGATADVGIQLYQTGEVDLAQTARAATAGAMLAGGLSTARRGVDHAAGTHGGPPVPDAGAGAAASRAAEAGPPPASTHAPRAETHPAASTGASEVAMPVEPPVGSLSRDLTPEQIRALHEPGRNRRPEEIMAKADLYLDLQSRAREVRDGVRAKVPEAELRQRQEAYLEQWHRIEQGRAPREAAAPTGPAPATGDRIRATAESESPTVIIPREAKDVTPKTERFGGGRPKAEPRPHETQVLDRPADHAASWEDTMILDEAGRPIPHVDGGVATTGNAPSGARGPHGTQRLERSPLEAGPHEETMRLDDHGRPEVGRPAEESPPLRVEELLPEDLEADLPGAGVEELLPEHLGLERAPERRPEPDGSAERWIRERQETVKQERAAREARRQELQDRRDRAPAFRAPESGPLRNPNFRQLVAGDAARLRQLMSGTEAIQSHVYVDTINAYAQRMIDDRFVWNDIPPGHRITLDAVGGKVVVHGHHRYIAARIASTVTGRPLTGGSHPIIPPHGFDPPIPSMATGARAFDIEVRAGFKPSDATTLPEHGTGAP